jgi:hypothetical protein
MLLLAFIHAGGALVLAVRVPCPSPPPLPPPRLVRRQLYQEIAEMYEEDVDTSNALSAYQQAADLFLAENSKVGRPGLCPCASLPSLCVHAPLWCLLYA